mmetsp:Transcript_34018/g.49321  ORF Transcript_34018/g.49321 Transcript_34018/m.49321 type:complete len:216 (-) Transcript_34018:1453-2100(-)
MLDARHLEKTEDIRIDPKESCFLRHTRDKTDRLAQIVGNVGILDGTMIMRGSRINPDRDARKIDVSEREVCQERAHVMISLQEIMNLIHHPEIVNADISRTVSHIRPKDRNNPNIVIGMEGLKNRLCPFQKRIGIPFIGRLNISSTHEKSVNHTHQGADVPKTRLKIGYISLSNEHSKRTHCTSKNRTVIERKLIYINFVMFREGRKIVRVELIE